MRTAYRNLKDDARVLLAVLLLTVPLFIAARVHAAAPPALTWTAPTLDSDNVTSVASPLTYNVYEGAKGPGKVVVGSQVTRTAYPSVKPGFCYQVSAVDKNGSEGLLSAEVCDSIPAAPTGLVIK